MRRFDFIWASPPCQAYTREARQKNTGHLHPDLIEPVRSLLSEADVPFVIENIPEAPLRQDLLLCGSMFGLRLVRHRVFEIHGFSVPELPHGDHDPSYVTVTGHTGGSSKRDGGAHFGTLKDWKEAMGIDWLTADRLREAIPPAYSQHIGEAAFQHVQYQPAAA